MLAAKEPLVVPMLLRLSHFKLSSYVVLVISKQKGITLVFKTDPLQNVDINSSFDGIAVIQKFIQREIEDQLRQMFREDLPGIIHRLSQQWVKSKVEAPHLNRPLRPYPPPPPSLLHSRPQALDTMSAPDLSSYQMSSSVGLHMLRQQSLGPLSYGRPAPSSSGHSVSIASTNRRSTRSHPKASPSLSPATASPSPESSDLENFDPTYGLRPEGVPAKSVFTSFGRLFAPNKGLADLAEDPDEEHDRDYDYDEAGSSSFDVVDWEDMVPDINPPSTVLEEDVEGPEYETLPAVGGGTITRPRIYHAQSLVQPPSSSRASTSTMRPRPYKGSQSFDHVTRGSGLTRSALSSVNAMDYHHPPQMMRPRSLFDVPTSAGSAPLYMPGRARSPDSIVTHGSHSSSGMTQSVPTPPSTDILHNLDSYDGSMEPIYIKRPRTDINTLSTSPSSASNFDTCHLSSSTSNICDSSLDREADPKIVLRPSHNNSIHQLTTLSHSNHTLSPYTRSLEHFTVRSVPPRVAGLSSGGAERQPVKARRTRIYRLSSGKKTQLDSASPTPEPVDMPPSPLSPIPPSEFDASDMDRYFRSGDDFIPHPMDLYRTHDVRRRPQASHRPSFRQSPLT